MEFRARVQLKTAPVGSVTIWLTASLFAFALLPFVAGHRVTVLTADVIFLVITGVASLLCGLASYRRPSKRPTWIAATGASFCWFVAQAAMVPEHVTHRDHDGFELIADIASMLVVPCLVAGLVALAHLGQSRRIRREIALDATLAIIASAAVAHEVVSGPMRDSSASELWLLSATIVWQVIALVGFFSLTVMVIWRSRAFTAAVAGPLIGGFTALLAGVVAYVIGIFAGGYHPGSPVDIPFLAGFLLLALAAKRSLPESVVPPSPLGHDYIRWRTGLVASSTCAVGGMAMYGASVATRDPFIVVLLVIATVTLACRVALGASDHLRLDRRTVERDRLAAVLDLSSAISGSLDPDQVLGRLAQAAARAGGRTHGRAVLLNGESAVEIVAAPALSAAIKPRTVDLTDARLITAGAALGARNVSWAEDSAVPHELARRSIGAGMFTSAVAPLVASGERLGYVEMWTPGVSAPASSADLAAVAAIGQQGGLALRNARLHTEMQRRAGTDELTGLLNRRSLFAELERLLGEASLEQSHVGLLLLDVDGFKTCNDTLGHVAGDRMLRELASMLSVSIRESDIAGRYGGDEFIVILPGADGRATRQIAERIREHARRVALVADGVTLRLKISIGSANARDAGYVGDDLIAAADRSMYVSKAAGRSEDWALAPAQ